MKQLVLLTVIFLTFCLSAFGQDRPPCYEKTLKAGINLYNAGKYVDAMDYFVKAKKCWDKTESNDLKTWIDRCNTKIAEQNKPAAQPQPKEKQEKPKTTVLPPVAPPQQQTQVLEPEPIPEPTIPLPPPDKLFVSDSTVYFDADNETGGTKIIAIDANKDWTYTFFADEYVTPTNTVFNWCKADYGSDKKTLRLTCTAPNISQTFRVCYIKITAGNKHKTIIVEQKGITNPSEMAQKFENTDKIEQAMACYQICADAGNVECKSRMGTLCLKTKDYPKAFRLLRESALQGDRRAQNNLGYMFENGLTSTKDETTAVIYYQLSAEQGYAAAQYNLARMYQTGRGGLKKNLDAAKLWYRKAAGQGDSDAIYALSKFK
jgi:tetratricopeptide (TPR) repeat protein